MANLQAARVLFISKSTRPCRGLPAVTQSKYAALAAQCLSLTMSFQPAMACSLYQWVTFNRMRVIDLDHLSDAWYNIIIVIIINRLDGLIIWVPPTEHHHLAILDRWFANYYYCCYKMRRQNRSSSLTPHSVQADLDLKFHVYKVCQYSAKI